MRLRIAGHGRQGYLIERYGDNTDLSPDYDDEAFRPVRAFPCRSKAVKFVNRYNRLFSTH